MREADFESRGCVELQVSALGGVEVFLFRPSVVPTRSGQCEPTGSARAGSALNARRRRGGNEGYASVCDRDAVLVKNRDFNAQGPVLSSGVTHQQSTPEQKRVTMTAHDPPRGDSCIVSQLETFVPPLPAVFFVGT